MKVFATLATILGVSSAAPALSDFSRHNDFRSMAGRHMPGHQMSDRQVSGGQMSDMRQYSGMDQRQYSGMDQMQGRQNQMFDPIAMNKGGKGGKGKPKGPRMGLVSANNMMTYDNVMGMSGRQMPQMADSQMSRMDMSGRQYTDMNMADRQMFDMRKGNQQMSQMDMSRRQYTDMNMADRQMSGMNMPDHQMSNMMSDLIMGNQQMSMRNNQQMRNNQVDQGVDQYYKQDDFGNYAYGYANGNSEKYEVGNPESGVKGHYMYIDSNGLSQKVEYVADDEGFRILGKDDHQVADRQIMGMNVADRQGSGMRISNQHHNRFTRSVEPDVMRSRMTAYMVDFPSLVDDDMIQMERGMYRNGMSLNNNRMRFDNIMNGNKQMVDRQMIDRQMVDRQMVDRHMADRQMFGREMSRDNMIYRDMDSVMGHQQMSERPMFNPVVDRKRDGKPKGGKGGKGRFTLAGNVMYDNDMSDMRTFDRQMSAGNRFFPSTFGLGMYSMDNLNMDNMRINDGVLGEQSSLSQRMEIERIPDHQTLVSSYRMF